MLNSVLCAFPLYTDSIQHLFKSPPKHDTFLTFANHQATFVSRHCIRHFLQTSSPPHVTVTSPTTPDDTSESIALLFEDDDQRVTLLGTRSKDKWFLHSHIVTLYRLGRTWAV